MLLVANRKAKTKPKKPRYVIRKVDPVAYAEEIAGMLRLAFSPEAMSPTAFMGVSWWVAFAVKDGMEEAVGCAGMCHSAVEEGTFYLNRSYVSPEHRGNGLQKKMIVARVARARELKGTACTSDTYDNPHSSNSLIECGFRAYSPQARWRIEGSMYWRLAL